MDECTIVMFFKDKFCAPRPGSAPAPGKPLLQLIQGEFKMRIVGITTAAQATSIHLIVTA